MVSFFVSRFLFSLLLEKQISIKERKISEREGEGEFMDSDRLTLCFLFLLNDEFAFFRGSRISQTFRLSFH